MASGQSTQRPRSSTLSCIPCSLRCQIHLSERFGWHTVMELSFSALVGWNRYRKTRVIAPEDAASHMPSRVHTTNVEVGLDNVLMYSSREETGWQRGEDV